MIFWRIFFVWRQNWRWGPVLLGPQWTAEPYAIAKRVEPTNLGPLSLVPRT